jgi:predicted DCC family thiol-disulfide oxidoreductase YuxK
MAQDEPTRPLLIYDGDCRFCQVWVDHWRALTGDRVDYAASQAVGSQHPDIPQEAFARAVQLVMPDGTVTSGAEAVFRALRYAPRRGWLLWLYQHVPGFAPVSEGIYRLVARSRGFFYWITMLMWGRELGPYSYRLTRWLFLRALGVIYLIAFASLGVQVLGLIGGNGIVPANSVLSMVRGYYPGADVFTRFPTLLWFNSSDVALQALCWGGAALALLLILDVAPAPVLALLWLLYLSLVNAGQDFLAFQWDFLLLESGFLAIFLAPIGIRPSQAERSRVPIIMVWLFRLLLFRLMLGSGLVKLASGDPTWHNLTALSYHYLSQPLPTPLGWYAYQLPMWVHNFSTAMTFVIELGVPFLYFLPRRPRFLGAALTTLLQGTIILTGNYTFFNLLTIVLCIPLLDDAFLRHWLPRVITQPFDTPPRPVSPLRHVVVLLVAALILVMSVPQFLTPLFHVRTPPAFQQVSRVAAPYGIVNTYGLFAVMTTTRPEIIVEGSDDGQEWKEYQFRYQPGDLTRSPPIVAPHQPRLDWQMWFAALGSYQNNPWFISFIQRLLQGSPEVLALLADNPFPDRPPKYIRAQLYDYTFTDAAARAATGQWWNRRLIGSYLPPVSLDSFS